VLRHREKKDSFVFQFSILEKIGVKVKDVVVADRMLAYVKRRKPPNKNTISRDT
jgi:hypothetical protein